MEKKLGRPKKDESEKISKTFKEYYQDPVFRERHMNNLKQIVECECGFKTSKVNLKRHQNGYVHFHNLNKLKK